MTEEQIAEIIDALKWYRDGSRTPRPTRAFLGEVVNVIEELQARIDAERADHEATIAHCEQVFSQWDHHG